MTMSSTPSSTGPPARVADLPDGRRVVVRPAIAQDVPGLLALFDGLDPGDRHRRFFSGFHPDEGFVRHLLELADQGGVMLVAEVTAPGTGGDAPVTAIVGEAEAALLPDGDAELGITVDRAWRGWLGPFLLGALADAAAARGIANLRAEVLVENQPMLVMVRARGMAVIDSDERCMLDTVFGTGSAVPTWPSTKDRPRVLIEVQGGRSRLSPVLRDAGFEVRACPGPTARPGHTCPMLAGQPCPLAEGADVVVHALGRNDAAAVVLLAAHGAAGTRPLVVDVRRGDPVEGAPDGAVVLEAPTPDEVRAVIESLLGDGGDDDQAERSQR